MAQGMLKRLFCRIGWHSFPVGFDSIPDPPTNLPGTIPSITERARCRWCQFEGRVDSQGNLY